MRTTFTAAACLVAAGTVMGQLNMPACATQCALQSFGTTGCSPSNLHCLCSSPGFITSIEACITKTCTPAEQADTMNQAVTLCANNGVTITLEGGTAVAGAAATSAVDNAVQATSATTTSSTAGPTSSAASNSGSSSPAKTNAAGRSARVMEWIGFLGAVGLGLVVLS